MTCPCGVDHWYHVAAGFQGIIGMMRALDGGNVPASEAAIVKLDEMLAQLQEQIARQKNRPKE